MKYNTIIKCDLINSHDKYKDQFLLTYKGCQEDMEIDLKGLFMFNCDYDKTNIKKIATVNNYKELYKFCTENDIKIPNEVIQDLFFYSTIYVGGGYDYQLDSELNVIGWLEGENR